MRPSTRHSRKEGTVSNSDKAPAVVGLDLVAFAEALAVLALALALVAQFSQSGEVLLQRPIQSIRKHDRQPFARGDRVW